MMNFYRRFLPGAAGILAPLNDLLRGEAKGKMLVAWTPQAQRAFEKSKDGLARATLLAHSKVNAELALFTDASEQCVGASLQQRSNDGWEPLAFFSRKLNPAEAKYSAFDRELAIYLAIKHFRHMLEARTFAVYTDHKPLIFAFRQEPEKSTPRQFRHLDFVGQFTTDIRHVSGDENVVADVVEDRGTPFPDGLRRTGEVVSRGDKAFVVQVHGETKSISINRLKPAYITSEPDVDEEPAGCVTGTDGPKQNGRGPPLRGQRGEVAARPKSKVRFPERFQAL